MSVPEAQAETAALLRRLTGREPQETHISAVFIGADRVFKLRKAVRLPFLDFTSLAERHRTAAREMELNAPHAPGLYRELLPVVRRTDGTLALGGQGDPVDWVVCMARVPESDFLDAIAARGGLDAAMLDAVADAVAAYHMTLRPASRDQAAGLRDITAGNVRSAHAAGLPDQVVRRWRDAMLAALDARAEWLGARSKAGFVRRAHGDLHLGNILIWQGRPVPFDALEFDEALATIDVGYDLAFLLMDLEHRAGRPAANRVLNRYVARTGDHGLVGGLVPFLSMRAMIRAHVQASRGKPDEARAYLDRAFATLAPPAPTVVAIGGLPGTGKSTLARDLAPELGAAPGALILRSDEIRKRRHGVAPEQRLPPDAYAEPESRVVLAALVAAVADVVAAGHAAIADATFMDPADREAVARAAGQAAFTGVWLQAPLAVLEARIAARRGDASDATVEVLRRAAAGDPGPRGWRAIDTTDRPAALATLREAVRVATGTC